MCCVERGARRCRCYWYTPLVAGAAWSRFSPRELVVVVARIATQQHQELLKVHHDVEPSLSGSDMMMNRCAPAPPPLLLLGLLATTFGGMWVVMCSRTLQCRSTTLFQATTLKQAMDATLQAASLGPRCVLCVHAHPSSQERHNSSLTVAINITNTGSVAHHYH